MKHVSRLAVAALALAWAAPARAADDDLAEAEKLLKEAKVGTDGPALLQFFRDRTLSEEQRERLGDAVRRLGDDNFAVREQASADLRKAGRVALPLLRLALRDRDPEVVNRARDLLAEIEQGSEAALIAAAARVLAARKPDGAARVLLAYLPLVDDDWVADALVQGLAGAGLRDGKADGAVVEAASDKSPARRAAAAAVLSRGSADDRKLAAKLLADADAKVRYRAADALLRAADKRAVPVLFALLTDGPPELAWQAEDLLFRLPADKPPAAALGGADEAARKKARAAWEDWWKQNEDKIDLAKLKWEGAALKGLTVVVEYDGGGGDGQGRVWECDLAGKASWKIAQGLGGPIDAQLLPGGRVLLAEYNATRVTERDRDGKVVWEHRPTGNAITALRLPNGNTLVGSLNEITEVSRDGKRVSGFGSPGGSIWCVQKLRNGNVLYVHSGGQVVESTPDGKQVKSITVGGMEAWGGVELLPNGNYLVAKYSANEVVEVDGSGKVVWRVAVNAPAYATRLPNGNTLATATNQNTIHEFDRAGKEVWKLQTQGRPFRVRRY